MTLQKPEVSLGLSSTNDHEISASGSSASSSKSSQLGGAFSDVKNGNRRSISGMGHLDSSINSVAERTQAGDLFSATFGVQQLPLSGNTITDQTDLLNEQVKMLASEVALCTSSLKRLREKSMKNFDQPELQEHMQKLKEEIREKKAQMHMLEQRMIGSMETIQRTSNNLELSQALSKLATQLNEKTFELEIKSADNRVLQEQLQEKAAEIESMKQLKLQIIEENDGLKVENQKLSEEASYAKELATAAAVELQNLAEEITKLSYQNAMLSADLIATKEASSKVTFSHRSLSARLNHKNSHAGLPDAQFQQQDGSLTVEELQQELGARYKREASLVAALSERDKLEGELRKKLETAKRYEQTFESELANLWALVARIRRSGASKDSSIEDPHGVLLTRSANGNPIPVSDMHEKARDDDRCEDTEVVSSIDELNTLYHGERKRCKELEGLLSKLKGDTGNLHILALDEVENFHVESIAKICHAKCTNHSL